MTKRKHPLLHHPWLLDKKYIFNECESVEKNCKKGGEKKSDVGKHEGNKKSECIQSHLEWEQKITTNQKRLQRKWRNKGGVEITWKNKNVKRCECEKTVRNWVQGVVAPTSLMRRWSFLHYHIGGNKYAYPSVNG